MVYNKPEIGVLGTAVSSILGHKVIGLEPLPMHNANRVRDSELDD